MNDCEITKVTIRIGDSDHVVTVAQAKALKAALEELFGKAIVEKVEHHHHDSLRHYWSPPKYVPPTMPMLEPSYKVTCDNTDAAAMIAVN